MGWFDFLKKNKKPQTEDTEKAPASNVDVDQAERTKSALNLDAGTEAIMQKEALMLQILDGLYDNPMKYLMQKRAKVEIAKMLNAFLDSRPGIRDFWSKEGKEIVPAVLSLLDDADKFAAERGMSSSPQRQTLIVNVVMLGGVVALFTIPGVMQFLGTFYIVIMCALCCVPQFLQRYLSSRLAKFQAANGSEFAKTVTSRLEIMHDMVQYLLTDIRETLLTAGNNISNIRFQLWNSDYKDIKVLDSKVVPGIAKTIYVVRFVKDDEDEEDDGPVIPTSTGPNSDVDFETDPNNKSADSDEDDSGDEDEAEVDSSGSGPEKKYP
jgi:hypothetical protein